MNKNIFFAATFIILQLSVLRGFSQGQWIWMKGDSTKGNTDSSLNSYGVKGESNPANTPPKMYSPSFWNDKDGNLWLIGGDYYYNDDSWQPFTAFWKFDIITNQWVWLQGTDGIGGVFEYGIQGQEDASNYPGGRFGASTWVDQSGNFWFFGGNFTDIVNAGLNDLWKYNTQTGLWTWMKGTDFYGDLGTYGTKGIADSANNPPARWMAESWTDQQGNLWLFGGYRLGDNGDKYLNDLWKYDIGTNEWTWINGSNLANQAGVYGALGIPDIANTPGARINNHLHWIDSLGNLYLYGGFTIEPSQGAFADLWKYDIDSNEWTWIGGDKFLYSYGSYNIPCVADYTSYPSSRAQATGWIDKKGNFWLFGGEGVFYIPGIFYGATNDLWKFNPYSNQWTWINGINNLQDGSYGTVGVAAETNIPKCRYGAISWVDTTGNFWIFGGTTKYWNLDDRTLNDVWKFIPDSSCGVFTDQQEINDKGNSAFNLSPNPANDKLTIAYSFRSVNRLLITDLLGRKKFSGALPENENQIVLSVKNWPDGIYIITAFLKDENTNGKKLWSEKVVVVH